MTHRIDLRAAATAHRQLRRAIIALDEAQRSVQLNARRGVVPPNTWFRQHAVDERHVIELIEHMQNGGQVPPVVVVEYPVYGSEVGAFMPLDGHYRLAAADHLLITLDAWIVDSVEFEAADALLRPEERAEQRVRCGGLSAFEVAAMWGRERLVHRGEP